MAPGAGNRVPTPKVGYSLNGYSLKAAGLENNQFRQDKPEFFLKNRKDRGSEITTIDGQQDYQSE